MTAGYAIDRPDVFLRALDSVIMLLHKEYEQEKVITSSDDRLLGVLLRLRKEYREELIKSRQQVSGYE